MSERVGLLLDQMDATRRYTHLVLEHVPAERWYDMPAAVGSHVAWQIGHIAWAQAKAVVGGVCGRGPCDALPDTYGQWFGKGTSPAPRQPDHPEPAELLATLDAVQASALEALGALDDAVLDEPAGHATGLIHDKLGLVMWSVRHEMLHIGQVGLIRRGLGMAPYR